MTKLRARVALCREAAGKGADFVTAADVDDRALEDRVYREAIDHGLDLAIVERATIAREEIVDLCTIFEIAFAHSRLLGQVCRAVGRVSGCYALSQPHRTQDSGASGALSLFCPHCRPSHEQAAQLVYKRCAPSTAKSSFSTATLPWACITAHGVNPSIPTTDVSDRIAERRLI